MPLLTRGSTSSPDRSRWQPLDESSHTFSFQSGYGVLRKSIRKIFNFFLFNVYELILYEYSTYTAFFVKVAPPVPITRCCICIPVYVINQLKSTKFYYLTHPYHSGLRVGLHVRDRAVLVGNSNGLLHQRLIEHSRVSLNYVVVT